MSTKKRWAVLLLVALLTSLGISFWLSRPSVDPWQPVRDLISQYEFDAASKEIQRLDPAGTNWKTHWLRARMFRYMGRMSEARLELQEAFKLAGDTETLQREQLFCLAMSGQVSECEPERDRLLEDPRGESTEIARSFVLGYYLVQRFEKANEVVEAWVKDYPNDAEPWYLKGCAYNFGDNTKDAVESFQTGLALNPRHWRMRLALAEAYDAYSKLSEAQKEYEQVVAQVPDEPKPWRLLGLLHIRMGDTEAAARCLEELRRLKAPEEFQLELEASLAAAQSDWGKVEKLATRLLEIDPNKSAAMLLLVRAYSGLGKGDLAAPYIERFNNAKARHAKLQLLFDETITHPGDVSILVQIGDESRAAGLDAKGYPWYLAAAEIDPNNKLAHERLARHFRETGNPERAKEHEEKAKTCPDPPAPASEAGSSKS